MDLLVFVVSIHFFFDFFFGFSSLFGVSSANSASIVAFRRYIYDLRHGFVAFMAVASSNTGNVRTPLWNVALLSPGLLKVFNQK